MNSQSCSPLREYPLTNGKVLYALYWFVGVLGAGVSVGWLEAHVFGGLINPWVTAAVQRISPALWLTERCCQ